MPFKTRKQKTAAGDRRITFSENAISYNSAFVDKNLDRKVKTTKAQDLKTHEDYFWVSGDLVKIIIISTLIISVQIVLAVLKFPRA